MSVAWHWLDKNPNLTGGCACYSANNPDQPKCGGWINPAREFGDLGYQSPHVFVCKGCINLPKDLLEPAEPAVVDATAIEIVEPKPAKRKAAPAAD